MIYIRPDYYDRFFCTGEHCPAPCPAPADMLWTQVLGNFCETGAAMACPQAAKRMLLNQDKTVFRTEKDHAPAAPTVRVSAGQLELMMDARKTMDIILQNRSLPLRSNVVLALTYGAEFDPMITTDSRYAYEELDWGFTEQPNRQLSSVVQLQGSWELKLSDLKSILGQFQALFQRDAVLLNHVRRTMDMLIPLSGQEYRALRDEFDRFMAPREYLFKNLLVYYNHRHFMETAEELTVMPGIRLMMVSYAVIRAMAARLYRDTGGLTDEAFAALCWHYARCTEEDPEIRAILDRRFREDPLYSRERLQRLLWQ